MSFNSDIELRKSQHGLIVQRLQEVFEYLASLNIYQSDVTGSECRGTGDTQR